MNETPSDSDVSPTIPGSGGKQHHKVWNCPHCNHSGNAPTDQTDGTLRCTHCGAVFPDASPDRGANAGLDLRRYELLDQLGAGGMGLVYRGRDPALGRDLAVKVMRAHLVGDTASEIRFMQEARVTALLQHPGIVPIHNLGRLDDNRLFFSMKLVQGRTLEFLLADRENPLRLGQRLSLFERVCEAVAYAHSKGVVHRDLKPGNVMVGHFGEVQVVDWGLAKVLSGGRGESPVSAGVAATSSLLVGEQTQMGTIVGTPAFMSPEQARGDVDQIDERVDVFALGAILCIILTGQPPYAAAAAKDVLACAQEGNLAATGDRLDHCSADAELVSLCKECLATAPEDRPRNAGVVAGRVAAYQVGVQERLRQVELEQARARAHALEAQRRRRLALALVAAVLLLIVAGGLMLWSEKQRQARDDRAVTDALIEARLLAQQAEVSPLDTRKYSEALAVARKAVDQARSSDASEPIRTQAENLLLKLQQDQDALKKDRRLLAQVLEVRAPSDGGDSAGRKGQVSVQDQTGPDERFAAAFREWGVNVDDTPTAKAAERLQSRPADVVVEIIAALDDWADERHRNRVPAEQWQRLTSLAAALEQQPDSRRRELRAILARDQLCIGQALSVLSAGLRPVPIPVAVPVMVDHRRLLELAAQTDHEKEPVLGILTLARALRRAGEESVAEGLLRGAIQARPREVVLHHALGDLLAQSTPPRWREVVECYTAARALRPEIGLHLASALAQSGRVAEALALCERLQREKPDDPSVPYLLGQLLRRQGDIARSNAAYDQAIAGHRKALDRGVSSARKELGIVLLRAGKPKEAVPVFREVVKLSPRDATAYNNLGSALHEAGETAAALDAYKQAVALDPQNYLAHYNLGVSLSDKGDDAGAMLAYRRAIVLNPRHPLSHHNLANLLYDRDDLRGAANHYGQAFTLDPTDHEACTGLGVAWLELGLHDRAITACKQALTLNPRYVTAWVNLGNALRETGDLKGAMSAHRRAIEIEPLDALAHHNLGNDLLASLDLTGARTAYGRAVELFPKGNTLADKARSRQRGCERLLLLEQKLPAVLAGQEKVSAEEALSLARMCEQKKKHRAATLLYGGAMKADPTLAANLAKGHRYQAARNALLAVAGRDADTGPLPEKDLVLFRHQALRWMRDELAAYAQLAGQKAPGGTNAMRQALGRFQDDPALTGVRSRTALQRLPEAERASWQKLWDEVDELRESIIPPS
jgi:serine/threonine-protein kinase